MNATIKIKFAVIFHSYLHCYSSATSALFFHLRGSCLYDLNIVQLPQWKGLCPEFIFFFSQMGKV